MQIEPEVVLEERGFNRKRLYLLLAGYLLTIAIDFVLVIPDYLHGKGGLLLGLNLVFLPTMIWFLVVMIRFLAQIEPVSKVTSTRLIFNAWVYGFELQWKDLAEIQEVRRGGTTILQFVMENQGAYIGKEKNWFRLVRMKGKEMLLGAAFSYTCNWVAGDIPSHIAMVRKAFADAKPQKGDTPARDWWFNDKTSI